MKLRKWFDKLLKVEVFTYVIFTMVTIESLGNKTYDIILLVSTIITMISFHLLLKYSKDF